MKKALKRFLICMSAFSVILLSVMGSFSVSGEIIAGKLLRLSDYTILDDKGMLVENDRYEREGYKYIYNWYGELYRAMPQYDVFSFVLRTDINAEEADARVTEIFEQYFPENSLYDTYEEKIQPDYVFKPFLSKDTKFWGETVYSVNIVNKILKNINDPQIAEARTISKEMMKTLNEENLISAFYDFGEVYTREGINPTKVYYIGPEAEPYIETITEIVDKNGLELYKQEGELNYWYHIIPTDEKSFPDCFNTAVEIYEATSLKATCDGGYEMAYSNVYGVNSLESDTNTSPSTTLGTVTIAGDLDLNEAVGTTDIVMLSKYVASAQIYPIEDATALANADVNQDGSINSDDTAVMIEMYLGAYEMI